mmetsp:Transcript_70023/g.221935  ORF Transcript_70023/g.221935 Transcript_70023/m.221935 type:complete len:211 (+) Transcript_70023:413-1045(+)
MLWRGTSACSPTRRQGGARALPPPRAPPRAATSVSSPPWSVHRGTSRPPIRRATTPATPPSSRPSTTMRSATPSWGALSLASPRASRSHATSTAWAGRCSTARRARSARRGPTASGEACGWTRSGSGRWTWATSGHSPRCARTRTPSLSCPGPAPSARDGRRVGASSPWARTTRPIRCTISSASPILMPTATTTSPPRCRCRCGWCGTVP